MAGIFISYRRDDSDVAAGRLAHDLAAIFGSDLSSGTSIACTRIKTTSKH